MSSNVNTNPDIASAYARILANPETAAMTKSALETIGYQEELNNAAENINDQFVAAQSGLVGQVAANKVAATQRLVDGKVYKHFFDVFQSGFALSQQWSEMEANV